MQVASHTNPQNLPLDAEGKRGWSNSLFDCFSDCGTCMFFQAVAVSVKFHLLSQVSPPSAVPALCTLRSTAGLSISLAMDLPIPLAAKPSAALVSVIVSLSTVALLVFYGLVFPYSPISAVGKPNHPTDNATRRNSCSLQRRR